MKRIICNDDVGEILQDLAGDYGRGNVSEIIVLQIHPDGSISAQMS